MPSFIATIPITSKKNQKRPPHDLGGRFQFHSTKSSPGCTFCSSVIASNARSKQYFTSGISLRPKLLLLFHWSFLSLYRRSTVAFNTVFELPFGNVISFSHNAACTKLCYWFVHSRYLQIHLFETGLFLSDWKKDLGWCDATRAPWRRPHESNRKT